MGGNLFEETENLVIKDTQFTDFVFFYDKDISGNTPSIDFFYTYWLNLEAQPKQYSPTRDDIHPKHFKPYLSRVVLLDVKRSKIATSYKVRVIGTNVAAYYGEITGQDVRTMPSEAAATRIYDVCNKILKGQKPILTRTCGISDNKKHLIAWALYMPLFNNNGDVEKILVYVDVHTQASQPSKN